MLNTKPVQSYKINIYQKFWNLMQPIKEKYENPNQPRSMLIWGWLDKGCWMYDDLNYEQQNLVKKTLLEINTKNDKRLMSRVYQTTMDHLIRFKNSHHLCTIQNAIDYALATYIYLNKIGTNFNDTMIGFNQQINGL